MLKMQSLAESEQFGLAELVQNPEEDSHCNVDEV